MRVSTFSWQHNLLVATVLLAPVSQAQQTIPSRVVEDTAEVGGISDSENLTQETRNILSRLRRGRMSSDEGAKDSRFSKLLEMHDDNFDGIADHFSSQNRLESEMQKAAGIEGKKPNEIGQTLNDLKKAEREKRKAQIDQCQKQQPSANCEAIVSNISPNIENEGSAHGGPFDAHRMYKVSDKAKEGAERVGQEYANATLQEIKNLSHQESLKKLGPDGKPLYANRDENGNVIGPNDPRYAPNLDLIQSEAAFLNQHIQNQNSIQWRALRARRLVGGELTSAEETALGRVVRKAMDQHGNNEAAINAAVAQEVANMRASRSMFVCMDAQGKRLDRGACEKISDFNNAEQNPKKLKVVSVREYLNRPEVRANAQELESVMQSVQQQAAASKDPKILKAKEQERATLAQCAQRGTWCTSAAKVFSKLKPEQWPKKADGSAYSPDDLVPVPPGADAGIAFTDTREFILHQEESVRKNRTPLNNLSRSMRNLDFQKGSLNAQYQAQIEREQILARCAQGIPHPQACPRANPSNTSASGRGPMDRLPASQQFGRMPGGASSLATPQLYPAPAPQNQGPQFSGPQRPSAPNNPNRNTVSGGY